MAAVFLWCIFAADIVTHLFHQKVGLVMTRISLFLLVFILVFVYAKIFRIGRDVEVNSCPGYGKASPKVFLHNLKKSKSCQVVVCCTLLCVLPMTAAPTLKKSTFVVMGFRLWSWSLMLAASSLNSAIFFWRNQILRKGAKKVLRQVFQGLCQ